MTATNECARAVQHGWRENRCEMEPPCDRPSPWCKVGMEYEIAHMHEGIEMSVRLRRRDGVWQRASAVAWRYGGDYRRPVASLSDGARIIELPLHTSYTSTAVDIAGAQADFARWAEQKIDRFLADVASWRLRARPA